jgi:UDP-N-acetylglucosamine 1-carboxyvinyltransferase
VVCVTETWQVEPSGPLRGDISVRGSKNAVTKHMVAAMLGDGPSTIRNAPVVGDVDITAAMLEAIGCQVVRSEAEITVAPGSAAEPRVPEAFTGLNRIPILMLGPLLHRTGEAFVPLVGGDPIGRRPVDFHVAALRALGAEVEAGPAGITARASRLCGARIDLPYPSVGATETVLLTAVRAEGKTVLRNAATEPEVVELALFLQRMGAHIELSPDRRIVIEGVPRLRGASRWLAGDRLEAFSYLVAGLISRGEVRVHGCPQDRLVTAITTLARMGARIDITDDWITA